MTKKARDGPVCLLDGNVLVALAGKEHVHHAAAHRWFASHDGAFATCPITQGTLVRMLMRLSKLEIQSSVEALATLAAHPKHHFWPDTLAFADVDWRGVIGQRQVTDAYLASLARHHGGKLVSFDRGLVALHPDVVIGLEA
jgi:uncharacterized protein